MDLVNVLEKTVFGSKCFYFSILVCCLVLFH